MDDMRGRAPIGLCWTSAAVLACTSAPAPRPAEAPRKAAPAVPPAPVPAPVPTPSADDLADDADAADGAAEAAPPTPSGPRLTSQGYISFIWRRPKVETLFIGYVRNGQSVALKSTETVPGD